MIPLNKTIETAEKPEIKVTYVDPNCFYWQYFVSSSWCGLSHSSNVNAFAVDYPSYLAKLSQKHCIIPYGKNALTS